MKDKKKKRFFVCFIDGYFKALHSFSASQNYYLYPLLVASEIGYKPVAIVRGGADLMVSDPHFRSDITVIAYKNGFQYFCLLIKYSLRQSIFYVNSHTIPSYVSLVTSKLFMCKTIFMGHIQPKRTTKVRQFIFNTVLFFVDKVRLNNDSEKAFLVEQKIDPRKLHTVPLVVNNSAFYRINNDYSTRKDIVYYGNTTRQKGLPTIFEAFTIVKHEFPEVLLHIVGSRGDYDPKCDIDKYEIEGSVILHGPYPHGNALNSLLNSFLVFVISTKGEGQCLAVYESALAGNALCLPRIMSFQEVFKDKALFHDLNDAHGLAKNIITYLKDIELIKSYNDDCIEMIQTGYSEHAIEKKIVSLLTF